MLNEAVVAELASPEGKPLPPTAGTASTTPAPGGIPGSVEELIVNANAQYNAAQEKSRAGNWADYGAKMDQLRGKSGPIGLN